jgi:hypothetical protein
MAQRLGKSRAHNLIRDLGMWIPKSPHHFKERFSQDRKRRVLLQCFLDEEHGCSGS